MVESVTFKPLARGRFRCNFKGCGQVVKQRRLDTHRGAHKKRPIPAVVSAPALKTAEFWYGRTRCPHCEGSNYFEKPGVVACVHCQKKFMAV